ncbi:MAG: glycoside hydrolase family 97 catalytic domain-containing protein [Phycisphaerae bacterium]
MKPHLAAGVLLALSLAACNTATNRPTVSSLPLDLDSPNNTIHLHLYQPNPHSQLLYSVTLNNHPALDGSLILPRIDGHNLAAAPQLLSTEPYATDDSYPTRAVHSRAIDRSNGLKLNFLDPATHTKWTLDLRAYDSGIAFRSIIHATGQHTPDEDTTFTFPAHATAWVQSVRGHYENVPMKTPIDHLKFGTFAAPPLTVELPDHAGYASVTEAAVYHYPGASLESAGDRAFAIRLAPRVPPSYPFTLRYGEEGAKRITTPVPIAGEITTPWRVVLIGKDLNTLVNSDILTSLNPPPDPTLFPKGQQTDWIVPGRAVWNYLDGGRDASPEGAKQFADLGSKLGFKHNVIEGYWNRWTDDELRDVCAYSKARGVHVWVWLTSDPARTIRRQPAPTPSPANRSSATRPTRNTVPEPANPGLEPLPAVKPTTPAASGGAGQPRERSMPRLDLRNPDARRKLFSHLHDLGVSGLKIDFIDTEAQEAEEFYEGCLKDAAEFHLMVNFHGSSKPTGEERTFPNELTREAIFGLEHRVYPEGTSAASVHTILPFARFLAGSGDYTPVIFGPRRYNTTWSHQLATAVVFTSALQTFAAHPANLLKLPEPAQDIIRTMPAVWDQTIVLPGSEIGECAAYARRSGNTWYLGVVNGETPHDLPLAFSFLAKGSYKVDTLNDTPDNTAAFLPSSLSVTRDSTFKLHLESGGGFVARFTRQ